MLLYSFGRASGYLEVGDDGKDHVGWLWERLRHISCVLIANHFAIFISQLNNALQDHRTHRQLFSNI